MSPVVWSVAIISAHSSHARRVVVLISGLVAKELRVVGDIVRVLVVPGIDHVGRVR